MPAEIRLRSMRSSPEDGYIPSVSRPAVISVDSEDGEAEAARLGVEQKAATADSPAVVKAAASWLKTQSLLGAKDCDGGDEYSGNQYQQANGDEIAFAGV